MFNIGDKVILRNCSNYNISSRYEGEVAHITQFYEECKESYPGQQLGEPVYNVVVKVVEDGYKWHINTKDLIKQARILKIL